MTPCARSMDTTSILQARFNKLTIQRLSTRRGKRNIPYAECKCDCGNTKEIALYNVTSGKVLSCGCITRNGVRRAKDRHLQLAQKLYRNRVLYRSKNKAFTDAPITFAKFCDLIKSPCRYCGEPPHTQFKEAPRRGKAELISDTVLNYNGIDRIDNAKGYVIGNVAACCPTCNLAKRGMSDTAFRKWIAKVFRHLN